MQSNVESLVDSLRSPILLTLLLKAFDISNLQHSVPNIQVFIIYKWLLTLCRVCITDWRIHCVSQTVPFVLLFYDFPVDGCVRLRLLQ